MWLAFACLHLRPHVATSGQRRPYATPKTRAIGIIRFGLPQIALAKIDLAGNQPQQAIERIDVALERIEPLIGHAHSWVGEAHLVGERAQ